MQRWWNASSGDACPSRTPSGAGYRRTLSTWLKACCKLIQQRECPQMKRSAIFGSTHWLCSARLSDLPPRRKQRSPVKECSVFLERCFLQSDSKTCTIPDPTHHDTSVLSLPHPRTPLLCHHHPLPIHFNRRNPFQTPHQYRCRYKLAIMRGQLHHHRFVWH